MQKIACLLLLSCLIAICHAQWNGDTLTGGKKIFNNFTISYESYNYPNTKGGLIYIYEKGDTLGLGGDLKDVYVQIVDSSGVLQFGDADSGRALISGNTSTLLDAISDNNGGVYATYINRLSFNFDGLDSFHLYVQHINGDGTPRWAAPGKLIAHLQGFVEVAELCLLSDNHVSVSWQVTDGQSSYGPIRAQKINSNSGSVLWNPNGVEISPSNYSLGQAIPVKDNTGGLLMIFELLNLSGIPTPGEENTDIYIQKINATGNALWGSGRLIDDSDFGQFVPYKNHEKRYGYSDASGGAYFIFGSEIEYNSDSVRVALQHVNSEGTKLWGANGSLLAYSNFQFSVNDLSFIANPVNGLDIAYHADDQDDFMNDQGYLMVQHFDLNGLPNWGGVPEGIAISNYAQAGSEEFETYLDLQKNAAGDLFIAYKLIAPDPLQISDTLRFAIQKVNNAGVPQWGPNGKIIGRFNAHSPRVDLASDGKIILSWLDARDHPVTDPFAYLYITDGMATRIDGNGNLPNARRIIYSITNGNWNNPATWQNGIIPTANDQVIIANAVGVSANASCYSLTIQPPAGAITIQTGVNLTILH